MATFIQVPNITTLSVSPNPTNINAPVAVSVAISEISVQANIISPICGVQSCGDPNILFYIMEVAP